MGDDDGSGGGSDGGGGRGDSAPDRDPWPVRAATTDYENEYFAVRRETVEQPGGSTADYYYLDQTDDVAVVALTDAGELVLVEQYRPRLADTVLECPAGKCDDGEAPRAAAARELEEETGYRPGRVEHLRAYYASGWERNRHHVLLATDLTAGEPARDAGEAELTVRELPAERALEAARASESPVAGWLLTPLLVARDEGLL